MRDVLIGLAVVVAAVHPAAPARADEPRLQDGAYAVDVRLLLPHIEDLNTRSAATLCLTAAPGANNHGFAVLSANNPLARCPASNIRREGDAVAFDIVCPGHNQAQAWARYRLGADRFQATIEMKMGGKNMTMTEKQVGHRVGPCTPVRAPRP